MLKALVLIIILFGLLSLFTDSSSPPSPETSAAPAAPVREPHAGARAACKMFIERRQLETANAVWGEWTSWTLVENDDGSVSVGARYAVGNRTRYTNCLMREEGADWRLLKLTRLQ